MEFKELKNICQIVVGGDVPEDFSKTKTAEFQIPILSNGIDEKALYGYTKKAKVFKPSVTISARGTIGFPQYQKKPYFPIVRLICLIPNENLNTKFLKYFLETYKFPKTISAIPQLTTAQVQNLLIPLPPLNQQQKIVNFLDKWTALIDKLETEQAKRTEQFNFYLNHTFQNLKSNKTPFLNLVEVRKGEQVNKEKLSPLQELRLYPVYNGGILPSGYYEKFNLTKNKITICSGGAAGDVKFIDVDFWAGGECLYIVQKSNLVDYKFVYFFLKHNQDKLINAARGGTIKHLDKNIFKVLQIPLIELKEQQRISMSLYKINYLTFKNLPKEIELRKQQFQYYLNQIFLHLK